MIACRVAFGAIRAPTLLVRAGNVDCSPRAALVYGRLAHACASRSELNGREVGDKMHRTANGLRSGRKRRRRYTDAGGPPRHNSAGRAAVRGHRRPPSPRADNTRARRRTRARRWRRDPRGQGLATRRTVKTRTVIRGEDGRTILFIIRTYTPERFCRSRVRGTIAKTVIYIRVYYSDIYSNENHSPTSYSSTVRVRYRIDYRYNNCTAVLPRGRTTVLTTTVNFRSNPLALRASIWQ